MEEKKKLSYEELQAYANNMTQQAEAMSNEIVKLRGICANLNKEAFYRELHFAFEVIKNADKFSKDFVKGIIEKIEQTMTPTEEQEESDNKE